MSKKREGEGGNVSWSGLMIRRRSNAKSGLRVTNCCDGHYNLSLRLQIRACLAQLVVATAGVTTNCRRIVPQNERETFGFNFKLPNTADSLK